VPTLRPALPRDLESLAALHVETWQAAYRGLIPEPLLAKVDLEHGRRRLVSRLGQDPPRVLLVEDQGAALGFCRFGPAKGESEIAEVFALNVAPAHWRGGHGRRLLDGAHQRLAAEGFREAWLWVLEGNQRAREFYEAIGWAPDGAHRVEGEAEGAALAELRYRVGL
jgi:ribosomal protein S18 acetylase RimI-like enzyme